MCPLLDLFYSFRVMWYRRVEGTVNKNWRLLDNNEYFVYNCRHVISSFNQLLALLLYFSLQTDSIRRYKPLHRVVFVSRRIHLCADVLWTANSFRIDQQTFAVCCDANKLLFPDRLSDWMKWHFNPVYCSRFIIIMEAMDAHITTLFDVYTMFVSSNYYCKCN